MGAAKAAAAWRADNGAGRLVASGAGAAGAGAGGGAGGAGCAGRVEHQVREVLHRGRGLAGGLLRPPPEIAAQAFERVVLAVTALGPL